MSSHADTIRRSLDYMHDRSGKNVRDQHAEALAHLDALLAENQQLREIVQIVKRRRARFLTDMDRNDEERRLDELLARVALAGENE